MTVASKVGVQALVVRCPGPAEEQFVQGRAPVRLHVLPATHAATHVLLLLATKPAAHEVHMAPVYPVAQLQTALDVGVQADEVICPMPEQLVQAMQGAAPEEEKVLPSQIAAHTPPPIAMKREEQLLQSPPV
jgi:hypothetical protein